MTTPVDVAASSTPTIALANPAGARHWFLKATSVDGMTGTAGLNAINASLSINLVSMTATFNMTSGFGTAVIFQSTVGVGDNSSQGNGQDIDGNTVAAFTTTFKVNVKTTAGLRVMALNEEPEQDSTFWWLEIVNAVIRYAGGSASAPGSPPLRKAGNYVIQPGDPPDLWMDTSSSTSGYAATFPANPFDGQRQRFKDNHAGGSWSNTKPLIATAATHQQVENPANLGTYSSSGGSVNLIVAGASVEFAWGATEGIWFALV